MINKMLNAKKLQELLDLIDEFCRASILRDSDDICIELRDSLNNVQGNDYLTILSSYMAAAEDGDEIVEALYEFVANCKGFVEADEEMTQQVTKDEFEAVMTECEDKCALMSCIEAEHTVNLAEVSMYNQYREFGMRTKNNAINLFLPKIDINTDKTKYISEELGIMLYNVLSQKLLPEYIRKEMNRYIPEVRGREEGTKQLFKEYFHAVVLYKERKPGIYLEIDDHMRRIFVLEFFKRIIQEYLKE